MCNKKITYTYNLYVATSSECIHKGISIHDVVTYDSLTAIDEFPTQDKYYLTEDLVNIGAIELTGNMDICLNGFDIEGIKFVDNNFKLTITNCKSNSKIINANNNNYLITKM